MFLILYFYLTPNLNFNDLNASRSMTSVTPNLNFNNFQRPNVNKGITSSVFYINKIILKLENRSHGQGHMVKVT